MLIGVGVLNSGETFPLYYSYYPSESAELISFVWESLKAECFLPGKAPNPAIILELNKTSSSETNYINSRLFTSKVYYQFENLPEPKNATQGNKFIIFL